MLSPTVVKPNHSSHLEIQNVVEFTTQNNLVKSLGIQGY